MLSFRALCALVQASWYVLLECSSIVSSADCRLAGIGAIEDVDIKHEIAARIRVQLSAVWAYRILVPVPWWLRDTSSYWTDTSSHAFQICRLRAYARGRVTA